MGSRERRRTGNVLFYEAAGALLFFGVFAQNGELIAAGRTAVTELEAKGYTVATTDEPVRIYPAQPGEFDNLAQHAGHWSPGVVKLRETPDSRFGAATYLRHELMHQANHRSCRRPLPPWADEAAAIAFSGELEPEASSTTEEDELGLLRRQVRVGAPLTPRSSEALRALLVRHGWPAAPCAVNDEIRRVLEGDQKDAGLAFRLLHLASARVFAAGGDQREELPPGSLLKLAYAAALPSSEAADLGQELARSDTEALLKRSSTLSMDTLPLLLGRSREELQTLSVHPEVLLGLRGPDGLFPLQFSLPQLALMVRAALLSTPENLRGLEENGTLTRSTLHGAEGREVLARLQAAAKTGTVSDEAGNPVLGTLAVWWPASSPRWLAVFHQRGVRGRAVLAAAAPSLQEWAARFPVRFASVRVAILGQFPLTASALSSPCAELPRHQSGKQVNVCGSWRVTTSLPNAQPVRHLRGIFEERDGARILETDALTYSEAVLRREADALRGEARRALQAVVVFDGATSSLRHPSRRALCDTTHCMVFQGTSQPLTNDPVPGPAAFPDSTLLDWLAVHVRADDSWYPFSKGGSEAWSREISAARAAEVTREPMVLELERLRDRRGAVQIVLHYADRQETVPCETFMTRFDLPACPEAITPRPPIGWLLSGSGAGHGEGLQVTRAAMLAKEGKSALQILEDAYREH